jgi:hypothetical protein
MSFNSKWFISDIHWISTGEKPNPKPNPIPNPKPNQKTAGEKPSPNTNPKPTDIRPKPDPLPSLGGAEGVGHREMAQARSWAGAAEQRGGWCGGRRPMGPRGQHRRALSGIWGRRVAVCASGIVMASRHLWVAARQRDRRSKARRRRRLWLGGTLRQLCFVGLLLRWASGGALGDFPVIRNFVR